MVDLASESLLGVSYGLLAGFVPALVFGLVSVGLGVVREDPVPVAAGVLTAPIAVALVARGTFEPEPTLAGAYRLAMVAAVAGLLGVVATGQGNRIATELPRDRTFPTVRGQALSADAIDAVDAMGQVTIRPTGAIREFDGYPPLSPSTRTALEEAAFRFPADLQLAELERRLERRLRTEYGLSRADVSIDGRGRAAIAVAPPATGIASTVPVGHRAVTVTGLVPSGLEPGDRVAVGDGETTVDGEVLAIDDAGDADCEDWPATEHAVAEGRRVNATDGSERRVTVAVEMAAASTLLEASRGHVVARSSGDNNEFEAAALLEAAGQPITALESAADETLEAATTLGVRVDGDWQFLVDGTVPKGVTRAFVANPATAGGER